VSLGVLASTQSGEVGAVEGGETNFARDSTELVLREIVEGRRVGASEIDLPIFLSRSGFLHTSVLSLSKGPDEDEIDIVEFRAVESDVVEFRAVEAIDIVDGLAVVEADTVEFRAVGAGEQSKCGGGTRRNAVVAGEESKCRGCGEGRAIGVAVVAGEQSKCGGGTRCVEINLMVDGRDVGGAGEGRAIGVRQSRITLGVSDT